MSAAKQDEPLLTIARAIKTKGLKGEIVAELLTDFPERFDHLSSVFAVSPSRAQRPLQLASFSFQKDRVVLKFVGYDTLESASQLLGCDFAVPESEQVKLAEDEFYDWELEGCSVRTLSGLFVGIVTGIKRTGGTDLLEVADEKERSSLIPMVSTIVIEINKDGKSIVIDPPEGLLEL